MRNCEKGRLVGIHTGSANKVFWMLSFFGKINLTNAKMSVKENKAEFIFWSESEECEFFQL